MSTIIPSKSGDTVTNDLVNFLPGGPVFLGASITGTNLRNLMWGLALELGRQEGMLQQIVDGHDLAVADEYFISLWEKALGIPDSAFPLAPDIVTRRKYVLAKLALCNVTSASDFISLANFLGYAVSIVDGRDTGVFVLPVPFTIFNYPQQARYTQTFIIYSLDLPYVLPLSFPMNLASSVNNLISLLFKLLVPANVSLIFAWQIPDQKSLITEDLSHYLVLEDGVSYLLT